MKKKNGENRLVIDYRRLNSQTVPEHFPLPNIDDQLQRLSGAQIYCVLDCANGYLQLPLSEESKAKTAFITPDEIGQFERMVFGLRNGPAVFQRLMNKVLGSLCNTVALCYMDDLLIPAKDWEELLVRLKQVLDALRAAGLTLKISKCAFGSEEIDYLGFKIAKGYLQPGEVKQQAILDASTPTDVHSSGSNGIFQTVHSPLCPEGRTAYFSDQERHEVHVGSGAAGSFRPAPKGTDSTTRSEVVQPFGSDRAPHGRKQTWTCGDDPSTR